MLLIFCEISDPRCAADDDVENFFSNFLFVPSSCPSSTISLNHLMERRESVTERERERERERQRERERERERERQRDRERMKED